MLTFLKVSKKIIILFCFLCILKTQAQLGFCIGNSGDPIVEETFGSNSVYGSLPDGSYSGYKNIFGQPMDGYYTIASNTFGWFNWFKIPDHTPNDTNGGMLIVNAGRRPGEFFRISVSGLCENTNYEFSSWLINLLPAAYGRGTIPINVSFEIWDSTNKVKLKGGNTGNIYSSARPNWQQYALLFKTKVGQTSVILKIRNNGAGGHGNDLALDDIVFKPCGDAVIIEDDSGKQTISVSKNKLPFSTSLTAKPDFTVFSTHAFQWQKSTDAVNWEDIEGETNKRYKIPPIDTPTFYRVKVAETANNLSNSLCNSNSEIFEIKIIEPKEPPPPPKKVIKRQLVKEIKFLDIKDITYSNLSFKKEKVVIPVVFIDKRKLPKTYKKVIIVKNGLTIIHHKVWVDGAIGKFVQTNEEIIKQGDALADIVVEETIYTKARYGYNSRKRIYSIQQ